MERKITKLEHSRVEVLVTVDEATWKDAQDKAFNKVSKDVKVDGFRPGKAPAHLLKAKVDQAKVMDEAINSLLPVIYRDVLDNEDIRPAVQPKVDVTDISLTGITVKFEIVTFPEVKLGQYSGLKVGHEAIEVSEEDLEKAMKSLLEKDASLVVKEDESKEGDTVVFDFEGRVDGELFEGGSSKNYELVLGSHSFVPGFEEQLMGHKAGEHVDVTVTFPEKYVEHLAGKVAVFACDIHEVKEKHYPELNDEFVKEQNIEGVSTVEELKIRKKEELFNQKTASEKRNYFVKLQNMIRESSGIDIAQEILDAQLQNRKRDVENQLKQSGLTLEQYLNMVGQKEEEFLDSFKEDVKKETSNYFILEAIGEKEAIQVNDEEVEFEYAKIADQYKMDIAEVRKVLEPQKEDFKQNLKMQRIEDFLIKNND